MSSLERGTSPQPPLETRDHGRSPLPVRGVWLGGRQVAFPAVAPELPPVVSSYWGRTFVPTPFPACPALCFWIATGGLVPAENRVSPVLLAYSAIPL